MRCRFFPFIVAALLFPFCGCDPKETQSVDGGADVHVNRIRVVATAFPTWQLLVELAPSSVDAEYVVPDGAHPTTWSPDHSVVRDLQNADSILVHGIGYESWLERTSLPRSRVVVTTSNISGASLIPFEAAMTHRHGPEGQQSSHPVIASTWLDPLLLLVEAKNVSSSLLKLCPDDTSEIQRNETRLANAVASLQTRLKDLRETHGAENIAIVSQRAEFAYLARSLGWSFATIDVSAPGRLADFLAGQAQLEKPRFFFHAGEIGEEVSADLASNDVVPLRLDVCDEPRPDTSLLDRLANNLKVLDEALE